MKKTQYQITICYKAIVNVYVNAENEKEAKEQAVEKFSKAKDRIYRGAIDLSDDNFKADGILDMDATWNSYDK